MAPSEYVEAGLSASRSGIAPQREAEEAECTQPEGELWRLLRLDHDVAAKSAFRGFRAGGVVSADAGGHVRADEYGPKSLVEYGNNNKLGIAGITQPVSVGYV